MGFGIKHHGLLALAVALLVSACAAPSAPVSQAPSAPPTPAPTAAPTAAGARGPLSPLSTSYPNVDMGHLHLWVAEDEGLFEKSGLDVSDQLVSNSAAAMSALLSGQTNIAQTGGSDAVSAAAAGADVVVLAVEIPVYTYLLEVPAAVTSLEQLRGGKIGIDSFGGSPDIAVRVALRRSGMDPDRDVTIVPVGNVPTRAAALMQGGLQATVLNPPSSLTVEDNGFHPLINMAELKLPAVSQTTIAQRSWVASHRELVQKYVDTLIEAGERMRQDKPGTVKLISKYLKNDDERAMSYTYDFYVGQVYPNAPFPRPDMFQDSVAELAKSNPNLANFDVSSILDPSFVQSAVDRGLVKP
jgi:NitT/TauT family transport system substrate-binding protein